MGPCLRGHRALHHTLLVLSCTGIALGARDGNNEVMNVAGAAIRADGTLLRVLDRDLDKGGDKKGSKGLTFGVGDEEFEMDQGKMAAVFVTGIEAIMQAVDKFVNVNSAHVSEDQMSLNAKEGLTQITLGVWEMTKLLVPSIYHNSDQMAAIHSQLSAGVAHLPNLTGEVDLFRREGDVTALSRAIMVVLAATVEASPHPKISTFIGALGDMMLGVGRSWQLQGEGRADLALQAAWQGIEGGLSTLNPKHWQAQIFRVDAAISMLSTRVLAYKRKSLLGKVCYKKAHIRPKKRPHICAAGYQFDGEMYCMPNPNPEDACLEHCANEAGMCSAYCGEAKACCTASKAGEDNQACAGANGYDDAFTHSQCVSPGPAIVFLIMNAGEFFLRGYWLKVDADVNGRPAYIHSSHLPGVTYEMQWSSEQRQWEIFKKTLDSVMGTAKATVYYASSLNSTTFPDGGWEADGGTPPLPVIVKYPFPEGFDPQEAHDLQPSLRQPAGVQIAECDLGWARSQLWCWGECPAGYVKKLEWCEQVCSDTGFPAKSHGVCGTTKRELMLSLHGMHMMGENRGYNASDVISELAQAGIDPHRLSATLNVFIDQGRPFSRPFCQEGVRAANIVRQKEDKDNGFNVHMDQPHDKIVYAEVDKAGGNASQEQSHEQSHEESHEESHEQSHEQSHEESHEESHEQPHEQKTDASVEEETRPVDPLPTELKTILPEADALHEEKQEVAEAEPPHEAAVKRHMIMVSADPAKLVHAKVPQVALVENSEDDASAVWRQRQEEDEDSEKEQDFGDSS